MNYFHFEMGQNFANCNGVVRLQMPRVLVLLERSYAYFCTLLQCFTPFSKYMIFLKNVSGMFPNFSNAMPSFKSRSPFYVSG